MEEREQDGGEKQSERQKGRHRQEKEEEEEGKLYLDNLIISHLQSTSTDAPSLHHAAHCEDRPSGRCWPVCRFPIISLAEGFVLPIHQHDWTRTL